MLRRAPMLMALWPMSIILLSPSPVRIVISLPVYLRLFLLLALEFVPQHGC